MFHTPRPSIFRRFWKPAAIAGAGGTAVVIWFEEVLSYAEAILALLFLPILVGVIYLFDIFLFKTRRPRREDLQQSGDKQ
jgi:hypothetical protein